MCGRKGLGILFIGNANPKPSKKREERREKKKKKQAPPLGCFPEPEISTKVLISRGPQGEFEIKCSPHTQTWCE